MSDNRLMLNLAFVLFFYGTLLNASLGACPLDVLQNLLDEVGEAKPVRFQRALDKTGFTISDVRANYKSTEELLAQSPIPKEAHKYYDKKTGYFNYKPENPIKLAVENGDAKLSAIRMNWIPEHDAISTEQLENLIPYLRNNPTVELWISSQPQWHKKIALQLEKLSPKERQQIKWIEHKEVQGSLWAQDGSKPLASGNETMVPRSNHQNPDLGLSPLIEKDLLKTRKSLFKFEGGNLIVGEKEIFVGPKVVEDAMKDFFISRTEALEALSREFGRPVVELGVPFGNQMKQVDFHIDLSMSIVRDYKTKKEVVLLDSETLALELLKKAAKDNGARSEHLKEVLKTLDPDEILSREKALNYMEMELKKKGYEVRRIPGLSQNEHIFNYTNSIYSGNSALVPEMGISVWDESVKATFIEMGHEVYPMPVAQKSLCQKGGIRCLSETFRMEH